MIKNLSNRPFLIFLLCLLALLLVLFAQSLDPDKIHFSNDGPLGAVHSAAAHQPEGFKGLWFDLNSIGINGGSYFATYTPTLLWILGPLYFSKFYVPSVLLLAGICAWSGFRMLKLSPLACFLGAMAAVLNSTYFSAICWGVGPHVIAAGMSFLAIGLLADNESPPWRRWLKVALAGFAVGVGVMEGFDLGALYSLVVAAFVLYQAIVGEGPIPKRILNGIARLAVVGLCAGFLAFQAVTILAGTQIKGIAGAAQDTRSKLERWDWATQWSLPKKEALSIIVPGLFGYRMDTPGGGNYWGGIGSDPSYQRYEADPQHAPPPRGMLRFSGGGNYLGVLVALIALWSGLQALRQQNSPFPLEHRKPIWFWGSLVILSLLLSFGRFAPFYQILYALPYFSTVRNPAKFIQILTFAAIFLFAYGANLLNRRYLVETVSAGSTSFKAWWGKAAKFDKRWVLGSGWAVALAILSWFVYSSSHDRFVKYLQDEKFDAGAAHSIAEFSVGQVGWFILLFGLAVCLFTMILSGRFSGPRVKWAGVLLGLLLVIDLTRADMPWIKFWDWKQKYASNPIIDFLRDKPFEHRVAKIPFSPQDEASAFFDQLYDLEWKQHHFQYYDVQSIDVVQMPRVVMDLDNFERAMFCTDTSSYYKFTRKWELTNTRYLVGALGFVGLLNSQIDPVLHRFRVAQRFEIGLKPGVANFTKMEDLTAVVAPEGKYALIEFIGAQPRARLYTSWQVNTNEDAVLREIASPGFDPSNKVLLGTPVQITPAAGATNQNSGTVEYASYAPKRIVLRARAATPSILLLNDKFDPQWTVTVDGKREVLLRCNYIMRGVQVPAGSHEIEFRFQPPQAGLYVSLIGIMIAFGLTGLAVATRMRQPKTETNAKAGRNPKK